MTKSPADEKYSDEEAQRRFMGALRTALNTPPKPMKASPKKKRAQQKKKAKKS